MIGLLTMNNTKLKEIILYLFFGGVAFFLNLILFFLFSDVFNFNALIGNVFSWIICVLFQYFTNKIWVFNGRTDTVEDFVKQIVYFFSGRILTLLVEEAILAVFIVWLKFNSLEVKLVAQVIVIVLNYLISKLFIFNKAETSKTSRTSIISREGGLMMNNMRSQAVFISSTYEDLKHARQIVRDAIWSLRLFPTGMEIFGANSCLPWEVIKKDIDEASCYVLIIGDFFGSEVPGEGISYTQKEFHYARSKGLPVLAFLYNGMDTAFKETDTARIAKLEAFRAEVKATVTVDHWTNPNELARKVSTALVNNLRQSFQYLPQRDSFAHSGINSNNGSNNNRSDSNNNNVVGSNNSVIDEQRSFEQFKSAITPILKSIMENDPTGSPIFLNFIIDLEYFIQYWQWPDRKFTNQDWEQLRQASLHWLGKYYELFNIDHFHLLNTTPDMEPRIFVTLDSWEAGEWVNEVLRPQSLEIRQKCTEIYQRLYS